MKGSADAYAEVELGADAIPDTYDVVVGRFVLMHQSDPTTFLRNAALRVKQGGVVAFLEMAQRLPDRFSIPPVTSHDETLNELLSAFRAARADLDVGSRLPAVFASAGLLEPTMAADTPVGGSASVLPEWLAPTLDSIRAGASDRPTWQSLMETTRMQAAASHSQLFGPRIAAAWVRIPRE